MITGSGIFTLDELDELLTKGIWCSFVAPPPSVKKLDRLKALPDVDIAAVASVGARIAKAILLISVICEIFISRCFIYKYIKFKQSYPLWLKRMKKKQVLDLLSFNLFTS
ncbi:hypothetical protein H4F17_18115 [Vibrio cholerae]